MRRNRKFKKSKKPIVIFLIFVAVMLTIGTAYSYLNQTLHLNGKASISGIISDDIEHGKVCQNTITSKTVTSWTDGYKTHYTMNFKLTNNNSEPIYHWHVAFKIPSDATDISTNDAEYEVKDGYILVNGVDYNSYVQVGSSIEFKVTVATTMTYEVNDVEIYDCGYEQSAASNIDLETVITPGGSWGTYVSQYTIDIKNNSTSVPNSWKIEIEVPSGSSILSLWNGDYVLKDNLLVITNKSYNGSIGIGSSQQIGMQIQTNIKDFTLNVKSAFGIK